MVRQQVQEIINGSAIAEYTLNNIKKKYSKYLKKGKECTLAVVSIGDDAASKIYVNNKRKACEKVGFNFNHIVFDENTDFFTISSKIEELNQDISVRGIIIQLPIISNVLTDAQKLILEKNTIFEDKDVDGFLTNSPYIPCTPKGIIRMLDFINYDYKRKTALVIGRSEIVGKPIAKMLLDKNCTVIQAHSKTPKETLMRMFSYADLVISAVGKNDIIDEYESYQYFKDNRHEYYAQYSNRSRVIIDVGINRDKESGKLCGDFSEEFKKSCSDAYSPVPGGVGPMTVAMLIENVWESFLKVV